MRIKYEMCVCVGSDGCTRCGRCDARHRRDVEERGRIGGPGLSCNCITYFHSGRFVPSSPLLYTNDVINEWFEFVKQHDVSLLYSPFGAPPRSHNVMIFWMQLEDLVYIRYTYELCFGRTHIGHILRDNKLSIIVRHYWTVSSVVVFTASCSHRVRIGKKKKTYRLPYVSKQVMHSRRHVCLHLEPLPWQWRGGERETREWLYASTSPDH